MWGSDQLSKATLLMLLMLQPKLCCCSSPWVSLASARTTARRQRMEKTTAGTNG